MDVFAHHGVHPLDLRLQGQPHSVRRPVLSQRHSDYGRLFPGQSARQRRRHLVPLRLDHRQRQPPAQRRPLPASPPHRGQAAHHLHLHRHELAQRPQFAAGGHRLCHQHPRRRIVVGQGHQAHRHDSHRQLSRLLHLAPSRPRCRLHRRAFRGQPDHHGQSRGHLSPPLLLPLRVRPLRSRRRRSEQPCPDGRPALHQLH